MVVGIFALKGGQYCHYCLMLSRSLVIIHDARPEIGDVPWTLISQMGQLACRLPFHIESRPITRLWIYVTRQPFDCGKDQTQIVDAPLTLTLETYQQSLGAQSCCMTVITSLLTVNTCLPSRSGLGH